MQATKTPIPYTPCLHPPYCWLAWHDSDCTSFSRRKRKGFLPQEYRIGNRVPDQPCVTVGLV